MAIRLFAEWEQQSFVQLTWPRLHSDWQSNFSIAQKCFVEIAKSLVRFQKLLIVCEDAADLKPFFTAEELQKITFFTASYNDSWARDHAFISTTDGDQVFLNDYQFTGWGGKFEAKLDNQLNALLHQNKVIKGVYRNQLDFILEGGAVESDGQGTLLTTSKCLLNPNRNKDITKESLEKRLSKDLGIRHFLWLEHGDLMGDDTDAHIDTLARFVDPNTIAYVQCLDQNDAHYQELQLMEKELKNFKNQQGEKYQVIPLPMPSAQYAIDGGYRLPATYANFLIINSAVLLPIYNCKEDDLAIQQIQKCFPKHQIIPIDCTALIQQHGSLHCVTMQYYH